VIVVGQWIARRGNVRVGEGVGGKMTAIKARADKQTSRWTVSQTGRQTGEEVMVEEKAQKANKSSLVTAGDLVAARSW
jgi:hypothetical protein